MSESPNTQSNLASLVPEFYYDLIGRVLPGVLVGLIYGWIGDIQSLNFGSISLGIVLGYFIGLTLDVCSDRIFYHANRIIVYPVTKAVPFLRVDDDGTLWSWTRTLSSGEQIPLKKMFAEKGLFRIAAFVAILSLFYPPPILRDYPNPRMISLAVAGTSLFCLHGMYKWMGFIKADRDK